MTEVFITLLIIGIVSGLKQLSDKIKGIVTVVIAVAIGALVGWIDVFIGLPDVSIAVGITLGLSAIGVTTVAQKINTGTK